MLIGTSQLRFFNSPSLCLTFVTHMDVGNAASRRERLLPRDAQAYAMCSS
jgi:hypothetical protein